MERSKYQMQLEELPEWMQKMVKSLSGMAYHGTSEVQHIYDPERKKQFSGFNLAIKKETAEDWWDGFYEMQALAQALTAPFPPPPAPERAKRAFNLVELVDDGEEGGGFDQPCTFGNRVGGHAVYCHNEAWPDSPRKCRRNRDDYKHEECPGYVANPDYKTQPA